MNIFRCLSFLVLSSLLYRPVPLQAMGRSPAAPPTDQPRSPVDGNPTVDGTPGTTPSGSPSSDNAPGSGAQRQENTASPHKTMDTGGPMSGVGDNVGAGPGGVRYGEGSSKGPTENDSPADPGTGEHGTHTIGGD